MSKYMGMPEHEIIGRRDYHLEMLSKHPDSIEHAEHVFNYNEHLAILRRAKGLTQG